MKKKLAYYLKNKIIVGIVALVLVVLVGTAIASSKNGEVAETAEAKINSIRESVEVTGKVAPFEKADLGFEKGGVLSMINVEVGDIVKTGAVIASLDTADALASLRGAEAALLGERARLQELQKGLRPEELSVETAKLKSSETDFREARTSLLNALHDSYVKANGALQDNVDILFTNPQSALPKITLLLSSYNAEYKIGNARLIAGENLRAWKEDLDTMTVDTDPTLYVQKVHGYLVTIKDFLSQLSTIVSGLSTGSSGLSQTTIDSYNTAVNTALATFNTAVASLAAGESAYSSASSNLSIAENQFSLEKAGSSEETLEIQMSKVNKAQADVLSLEAELAKRKIISPIDGIVTRVDAHRGEFISPGVISFAVISDKSFKVEIFVPEVDIAKIRTGNIASIKLDAYGDDAVFPAHVVAVDPAETIVEGVPTYKVTLQFDEKDERARSGMTANIEIETNFKENVLTVPYRALIQRKGESFVRVVSDDDKGYSEVKVTVGLKGSDGMVEIKEGISEGTMVVTVLK